MSYRVRVEYKDGRIEQFRVSGDTKRATEELAHREADSYGLMPNVHRAYVLVPGETDPIEWIPERQEPRG